MFDYVGIIKLQLIWSSLVVLNPQELLATITGGRKFTKLDLPAAYKQIVLDEQSSKLVIVNNHLGLFRYCQLLFGVVAAPAIFQHAMDTLLQGIPNVICSISDLLVTSQTDKEHLQKLERVFTYWRNKDS